MGSQVFLKGPYLFLLATAAHTSRIAITARMVRMITNQSAGTRAGKQPHSSARWDSKILAWWNC